MSLCWWQQLFSTPSEAVILQRPLCSVFFHLVFRDKTYCDILTWLVINSKYWPRISVFGMTLQIRNLHYGTSKNGWFLPNPTQDQNLGEMLRLILDSVTFLLQEQPEGLLYGVIENTFVFLFLCIWVPLAIAACLYLCLNPFISTSAHWENSNL